MNRSDFIKLSCLSMTGSLLGTACSRSQAARPARQTRILIIGAGLSGLTAAQDLVQDGYDVLVLEAKDHLGGRTWTSQHWLDTPLDLGASWIHGIDGNPLTELAQSIGSELVTTHYDRSLTYGASGTLLTQMEQKQLESLHLRVETVLRRAQHSEADRSVQTAVRQALVWQELSATDQQLVEFILNGSLEHEYAGSTAQLSAHWYDDSDEYPGEDALLVDGYQSIVDHLATGLNVELGQVVKEVDWSREEIVIRTHQTAHRADRVIVTLPLGVLKTEQVSFTPNLPEEKIEAIRALGMGVLNKCYLRFPQVFWPDQVDWIEQIPANPGEWSEWVSFAPTLNKPILLGFNAADPGKEIETWSDEATIASAMKSLRRLFGNDIPEPFDYQITRWLSDPYARGSYSFNALGSTPKMRNQLAKGLGNRLFFAGEATHRKYFGTAHGAYLSGLRVAQEVKRSMSSTTIPRAIPNL